MEADLLPELKETIWDKDPELSKKSVINMRGLHLNDKRTECNYCSNPVKEENHFYCWGMTCTKLRTDDYEKALDLGWQRSGTWLYRPDIKKSCCPLYTPRIDITEFKISKQQKKHMKRFNQYINGTRLSKSKTDEVILKDPEEIKRATNQKQYDSFLENLKTEREEIRNFVFDSIFNKETFIDEQMTDEKKKNVRNLMKIEDIHVEEATNNRAHYICDIVNVVMQETGMIEPEMRELIEPTIDQLLSMNSQFLEKYDIYQGYENQGKLIFVSKKYISIQRAKEVIFNDDEEAKVDENNEFGYKEHGEEQKIAQEAGNSRSYTEFFEEFVPNITKEEERKHRYTVSLHRAICYEENLQVFRKFDYIRFNKERVKSDFERFLTNSPLYDPKDPNFPNSRTFRDDAKIDGERVFIDEGVSPKYFGSYHMHHRIDGRLVAINVLDITENTMSSIYTFYDPEYSFLSLGQVTAVREIEYMLKIRKEFNSSLKYYYMGYYVHNCQKSVYKEHMHPQNLLCPITYTYVPLTPEVKAKIAAEKFCQLNEEAQPVKNKNFAEILEYISSFKLIHERDNFLHINQIRSDMSHTFSEQLVGLYQIMGSFLFETFIFEYL
ncbi:unnamed protein product [Moneuplotes crassus]|uniref:Arginyl-tRNA--protein transferase 1 n=1 Tax=Euplotes crassus TaxID=5936 RepID=A0AAD1UAG4_EUPCR|nr:unnamed protein product [Moneuplotes crassus]